MRMSTSQAYTMAMVNRFEVPTGKYSRPDSRNLGYNQGRLIDKTEPLLEDVNFLAGWYNLSVEDTRKDKKAA